MPSTSLQLSGQQVTFYLLNPISLSVLSFIFTFFLFKWLSTPKTSQKNLPPSPPKLPFIGNMHQLGRYPHRSLQMLAQRHGPMMLLQLGSVPVLVVSSADAAREIMKTHDVVFSNRIKSCVDKKVLYDCKDITVAPYGEYWRQMRSICVLQLLSNTRVRTFRRVREEETALLIKKIKTSCSLGFPLDLSDMFMSLTYDVISRVAFGRKHSEGEEGKKFRELLKRFQGILVGVIVGDFIPWLGWIDTLTGFHSRLDKIGKEFDQFLDGVVEEHIVGRIKESNGDGIEDLVDVLLRVQREITTGFPIERDNIKAVILDIFVGGTDTTYTVLEWAMTELIRHPRVMREVKNELMGIAKGKQDITEDDLDKLHYLKAVIKETLRLYPPFPLLVPRESTQDVKIMGYDIAAQTLVFTNAWAIGRDPAVWSDPVEFQPERFINSSIDFKGQDFQLIPFGAGRRGCPGMFLAMATTELVLANIVHKFDWGLPSGVSEQDLDMTECAGVTSHRKFPLLAVAAPSSSLM